MTLSLSGRSGLTFLGRGVGGLYLQLWVGMESGGIDKQPCCVDDSFDKETIVLVLHGRVNR